MPENAFISQAFKIQGKYPEGYISALDFNGDIQQNNKRNKINPFFMYHPHMFTLSQHALVLMILRPV